MISFQHDPDADAVSLSFTKDPDRYVETREVAPGVMVDLDANGIVVAIEVLHVADRVAHVSAIAA